MSRAHSRLERLAACIGLLVAWQAYAQTGANPEVSGRFSIGVRGVDVDGSQTKYREDIDLDDGPRLLDLGFVYRPGDADAAVDLVELEASNLGGDPFENLRLNVRNYGVFDFKLARHRSQYFYQDVLTPHELASIEGSTGGDFHHFDFERVRDTAQLDIHLSPRTELSVNMEHFTRKGDTTTTLDIQRDEFELDQPLDESLGTVGIGVRHAWDKVTLIAEERVGDFESSGELFLPGASAGENADDLAALEYFRFNQPSEYDQRTHTLRVLTRPTDRLRLDAGWQSSDLDLDVAAVESSAGTTFLGSPFSTALTGFAAVERQSDIGELELGIRASDRVELSFSARNSSLDQLGLSELGDEAGSSSWGIETDTLEASVGIAVGASVVVTAGWSIDDRDVTVSRELAAPLGAEIHETDHDGFFVELSFNPAGALSLTAAIEDDSVDDAYTLSSPTDGRRYRLSGRYRWDNGLSLSGSFRVHDLENELSGWHGDTEQADLRLGYQAETLQWSLGYGAIEYSRNVEQLVTGGTRADLFAIAYGADSDFVDGSVRWQARPNLALGALLSTYESSGSFAVERDDFRAYVELDLDAGYVVQLAYRDIGYEEDVYDDYDAEIVEVAVGFRW